MPELGDKLTAAVKAATHNFQMCESIMQSDKLDSRHDLFVSSEQWMRMVITMRALEKAECKRQQLRNQETTISLRVRDERAKLSSNISLRQELEQSLQQK